MFTSFSPKKNRQFSQKIKVQFLDKNEDFEQCVLAKNVSTETIKIIDKKSLWFIDYQDSKESKGKQLQR